MASREFAEIEIIGAIAERMDVAVGIIDVKSYYIETPDDVAERVRLCLEHAPAERLAFAPDCGLSQTARWAARQKLANMVEGVRSRARGAGARVIEPGAPGRRALLADIARREPSRWTTSASGGSGRAAFCVQCDGRHLLLDPYLSDSLTTKYADDRQAARAHDRARRRPGAARLRRRRDVEPQPHRSSRRRDARAAAARQSRRRRSSCLRPTATSSPSGWAIDPARPGGPRHRRCSRALDAFRIEAVPAAHEDTRSHSTSATSCAAAPWTLYHSGDTVLYDGLADRLRPHAIDVALLPINGRAPSAGRRQPRRRRSCAASARAIGARSVIPCHYEMFAFNTADPAISSLRATRSDSGATCFAAGSSGPRRRWTPPRLATIDVTDARGRPAGVR